jgi:hypothetical protein
MYHTEVITPSENRFCDDLQEMRYAVGICANVNAQNSNLEFPSKTVAELRGCVGHRIAAILVCTAIMWPHALICAILRTTVD